MNSEAHLFLNKIDKQNLFNVRVGVENSSLEDVIYESAHKCYAIFDNLLQRSKSEVTLELFLKCVAYTLFSNFNDKNNLIKEIKFVDRSSLFCKTGDLFLPILDVDEIQIANPTNVVVEKVRNERPEYSNISPGGYKSLNEQIGNPFDEKDLFVFTTKHDFLSINNRESDCTGAPLIIFYDKNVLNKAVWFGTFIINQRSVYNVYFEQNNDKKRKLDCNEQYKQNKILKGLKNMIINNYTENGNKETSDVQTFDSKKIFADERDFLKNLAFLSTQKIYDKIIGSICTEMNNEAERFSIADSIGYVEVNRQHLLCKHSEEKRNIEYLKEKILIEDKKSSSIKTDTLIIGTCSGEEV